MEITYNTIRGLGGFFCVQLNFFFLTIESMSFMVIGLTILNFFLLEPILAIHIFLENFPFHLSFQIRLHKVAYRILLVLENLLHL